MTTTTEKKNQEQAERDQLSASNRHLFTITFPTFPGPTIALLEVCGAASQGAARAIAWKAFKHCRYAVKDGDQTGGHSQYVYTFHVWASAAAQEHRPNTQEAGV